QTAPVPKAISK
uniref:Peptide Bm-10 n=1 Tax=Batozonellus maculifrons TaxID=308766 RepID=BM10_BATMC|nr:RecName: Full=Peptide Bm-10 [Batozonellus maculifrons]